MKIGIIGLPQSGKTTIFNAAAGKSEIVGDYSRASHRAIIKVPDFRLDRLSQLAQPKKTTPAEIDYLDICAFTGKGKQAESAGLEIPDDLRYSDALMVVIDCFSPDCTPERNFNLFVDELILSDQIIIERNYEKKARTAQLTGDKEALREAELLKDCLECVENAEPLSMAGFDDDEKRFLKKYSFLSIKPLLVVLNIAEDDLGKEGMWLDQMGKSAVPGIREFVSVCGSMEMELAALDDDDRVEFMQELGIERPAMELLIQKSYALLGLISFFTVGDPEARAWTIPNGTMARKAAGAIHTDIERGFIRAEVIKYNDFDKYGSTPAAKDAGKYHVEGKEYIVRDGDVILVRFNI
jgi:GTP-binding protein YchF